jgi:radical SAM superfamily enzyme YgiQ (UPF0313 family)
MFPLPIQYDEPLFRPPSEARSLILQVTLGCSWNRCAFCEMYTSKQFRIRKEEDIYSDIDSFQQYAGNVRRVFLADGDPLILSTVKLLNIISKIKSTFPKLNRISCYASPGNLNRKSFAELKELKDAGLNLLYVGIESGDDKVLSNINKGETFKSTVTGLNLSKEAGLSSSVMIINGLGGIERSKEHAINSARVLNETQAKYASTLVLSMYKGLEAYKNRLKGSYTPLTVEELLLELQLLIDKCELKETIFRTDHASNYLVLKGVLSRDKQKFMEQIAFAIKNPGMANLREEYMRGL